MNHLHYGIIFKYDFTEEEIKAYKLALIWIERVNKTFPDYKNARLRKDDPRKSILFKYCYKLQKETETTLNESDYELYVRAQLEIFKALSSEDNALLIGPHILAGDNAWKRWKLWKKKYDSVSKVVEQKIGVPQAKIINALNKTKQFLVKSFDGLPDYTRFKESIDNGDFIRWIKFGKISPYYLLLSPYIRKSFSREQLNKVVNFDLTLFEIGVNDDSKNYFASIFDEGVP